MQYLGTIDKAKDIINKDFVEKLLGDYQPLINESSKLPYSLISGVPTSLPASDVYPWAKEENKPSYSYSEITGAISTTELQNYLTQNSYLNVTSGDNRYLQLSGGTISNNGYALILNRESESPVWIQFRMQNEFVGAIGGENGALRFMDKNSKVNTVWHSGNDGSGSTLDADLLDGLHNGELTALVLSKYSDTWNYSLGNPGLSVFSDWNNTQSLSGYFYGISIESIDNRFRTVLATPLWIDGLHWRQYSDGAWQEDWRCLIDSYNIGSYNAGSATKLQTARTIWGQSFDGTGNIDGDITATGALIGKNSSGNYESYVGNASGGVAGDGALMYAYGSRNLYFYTKGTCRMFVDSSGNVGIGTTNPSTKLDVHGSLKIFDYIDIREPNTKNRVTAYVYSGIGRLYSYNDDTGYNDLYVGQNSTNAIVVKANGNVGIGTADPAYKLDVNGDIATSQYLRVKAWSGYGSGICSMWYNGNTTQLVLDSGASLGYNLDVNGIISANSSNAMSLKLNSSKIDWGFAYNSIGIYHSDSQKGGFGWNSEPAGLSNVGLYFKNYVSGDCISLFNEGGICFIGGNVGIGTPNPERSLVVSNKGAEGLELSWDSSYGSILTYNRSTKQYLPFSISASVVNIGVQGVTCNLLVTGGITMYSDQRKKTILNHVELSLKQIADAPLIEHYYNSDESKTTHVGSIAQYWASMNDWFCKLDSEGFYTMEIQNAALASAISIARELDRYETKTDKAIKKLKKRICELEEEVERLKSA